MGRLRRVAERAVYGFLAWFESFDSIWQTTLACSIGFTAAVTATVVYPRSLLVALLISMFTNLLSVYATFTQNGLAHENKLNSEKLDAAIGTLLQLARNEAHMQEAIVAQLDASATQTRAVKTALAQLRRHLKPA